METQKKEVECCPPFNPAPWNDTFVDWTNKLFVKDHVCTLFYMPLNFGGVISRLMKKVDEAQASSPDYLGLSYHSSPWRMEISIGVSKPVVGLQNESLSGRFYSRVYEGKFSETGRWNKDFEEKAKARSLLLRKTYFWYTTCPKCAKKYGKNYVVILGEVQQ